MANLLSDNKRKEIESLIYQVFDKADPSKTNSNYYKEFISEMKTKYKLTPADKINKMLSNINLINTFLDVLK